MQKINVEVREFLFTSIFVIEYSYLVFSIGSNGTTASFLPSEVSIFISVSICGMDLPFSILAITGCLTPLSSSNFLAYSFSKSSQFELMVEFAISFIFITSLCLSLKI